MVDRTVVFHKKIKLKKNALDIAVVIDKKIKLNKNSLNIAIVIDKKIKLNKYIRHSSRISQENKAK